ncbi:hypothetical protein [Paraburkholderia heleia]|uniref:hypothetical protein n=1 Tax=Paraburkholderia heleia TaxID=634127 RepID=UPI002AB62CC4|nr:hypothetical protein [Paraburkholderia heleia]
MYAIVENGVVVNVVVWDGSTASWQPPDGATAVAVSVQTGPAYIGGTYANGVFAPTSA